MKFISTGFLLFALLITYQFASAQSIDIPKDVEYKVAEDYAPYFDKVKELMQYLKETPIGKEEQTRKNATQFAFMWLQGAPTTHIEIHTFPIQEVLNEKHQYSNDLMMSYIFGMALATMGENPVEDKNKIQLIGIENMINAYQKMSYKQNSKSMKQLIKLQKKGNLEKWIKASMPSVSR